MAYIYKTTNINNGKIYIGKKEADEHQKEYFGSGKILKNSIEKNGNNDHLINEVIEYCDLNILDEREIYWINCYYENGYDLYNIAAGGTGGNTIKFKTQEEKDEIYKKALNTKIKNNTLKDTEKTKKKKSLAAKKRIKEKPHTIPDNKGRIYSEIGYLNLYKAAEKRRGNIKINNGEIEKEISPHEKIPEGFIKGRLPHVMKRIRANTNIEEANEKRRKTITGSKCYTNGVDNVWIKPHQTPPKNYRLGMTKRKKK